MVNPLDRWPARLAEILELFEDEIRRHLATSQPPLNPRHLAAGIVTRFVTEHGGSNTYIPKGDALNRLLRNMRIYAEHDGSVDGPNGIRALGRRHGLSEIATWSVIKSERALRCAQRDADTQLARSAPTCEPSTRLRPTP